jgi:aspartyl-tRNA(Asn)/glutamyl-tRNA(Gln) amidotransferase subunit A
MEEIFDIQTAMSLYRDKKISPLDLTRDCLERIERLNPKLNAFITVTRESALQEARRAELEINRGQWRGPLHGIPIALKDLIDTNGSPTTAASEIFKDRIPDDDAEVVRRLRQAGAVILGKLNLHEFAYGGTCVPSYFGPVRNPWDPDKIAGGSSGGSGVAVAARLCLGALGTDTAASVRHPAAYCGVTGLKPTYGRVSTRGVVPLSWSLDHVGPICRTAFDTALMLEAIAGHDENDPTSAQVLVDSYVNSINDSTAGMKLGWVRHPYFDDLDVDIEAAVTAAMAVLSRITSGIVETHLPYNNLLLTIASAEAYAFHREFLEATPEKYQSMTRLRLQHAKSISASEYIVARREMEYLRSRADDAFHDVDLLLTPTTAISPIQISDGTFDPPLPENGTPVEFRNTHMFDVLGLPAISIPCGFTRDGMPIGLQIAGPRFSESRVLRLAHAYQAVTEWHRRCPLK